MVDAVRAALAFKGILVGCRRTRCHAKRARSEPRGSRATRARREPGARAGFFDLFERLGGAPMAARLVREAVSEETYAALVEESVVVKGARAESVPCVHQAGCEREVREVRDGGGGGDGERMYLAVCGQTPPECDAEWVREAELARVRIEVDGVLRVVRRLFGVKGAPRLVARGEGAQREREEPIALGVQERSGVGESARDAFFATRPEAQLGAAWLAMRERAARRRSVVFVPTAAAVGAERMARHAREDRVEIVALERRRSACGRGRWS